MARIKGWQKKSKTSWYMRTKTGKQFHLAIVHNKRSSVFPYTVILRKGTLAQRHHEDTKHNAQKRATKIMRELSRKHMK